MQEVRPPSPPIDPKRWTYAGDLDDMVSVYPWPNIKPGNKRALDVRLALGAVTCTPVLLNDGYLILNQACFDSLSDAKSPLRVLINQDYIRVLSRNPSHSLSQAVTEGARQGILSYKNLTTNNKKWNSVRKVLDGVQEDLKDRFCGWPRVDLTKSYLRLIHRLAEIPYQQRGLSVPDAVFQRVVDSFDRNLNRDANRPRSRWEQIAKKVGQGDFISLMQLANEVYHHNFGVALTARPPVDLPPGAQLAVQTRISQAFLDLYKTHTPKISTPESIPCQLQLPGGVDYSEGSSLAPLFLKEQPLGKARANYLEVRAHYLAGKADADAMKDATNEYQRRLNEHLDKCPREKTTTHVASAAVASVPVVLAVTATVALPVPTILVATVAFVAAEFGVPIVTEKWRVPQKMWNLFKQSAKLNPPEWADRVATGEAFTALAVNQELAHQLLDPLPMLA